MLEKIKKKISEEFVASGVSKIEDGEVDMVIKNKDKINKKLSGRGLKKYAEMGKIMFGMLNDYRKGRFRQIPWFTIAAMTFAMLYIFNPMDLMPDFIPGLGYVDDFAVFTVVLRFVETDLHSYLDWKLDHIQEQA